MFGHACQRRQYAIKKPPYEGKNHKSIFLETEVIVLPAYSFPESVPALTRHPVIDYAVSKLPTQAGAIRLLSDSFNYFISRHGVIFFY